MARSFAEIAFTPDVLEVQNTKGSARAYAEFLEPETDRQDRLGEAEAIFIAQRNGFYQATVSQNGWPYVQYRGGPTGFLKVLDPSTVAYADFRGNRQYLSTGNLAGNDRVSIILMDYPNQRRLKLWATAKLVDIKQNAELVARLHDPDYRAKPERAVVLNVKAFDWNCPQHIVQRFTPEELESALAPIRQELSTLRDENAELKSWLGQDNKSK